MSYTPTIPALPRELRMGRNLLVLVIGASVLALGVAFIILPSTTAPVNL